MAASKAISVPTASVSASVSAEKRTPAPALARIVTRAPASRAGTRYLTPKDLSRELTAAGILCHEQTIRRRCGLPAGDALHIATHPDFPGRHYIPDTELARLLSPDAPDAEACA